MSLSRTALRLAVVEALKPHGTPADGPWPTMAKALVFDSSYAAVDDLSEQERRPVVQVFTDETEGAPRNPSGGTSYLVTVDLRFELSVPQLVRAMIADPENPEGPDEVLVIDQPETDAATEAALDLLETQILDVLHRGATGAAFRRVFGVRILRIHSEPLRSSEEKVRIGMRTVTLKVSNVPQGCNAPLTSPDDPEGLERLPEPLRSVALSLPVGSEGRTIAETLAAGIPLPPRAVPLERISLGINVADPISEADSAADVTVPITLEQ